MPELTLIQTLPHDDGHHGHHEHHHHHVSLRADRTMLAKRRWRGVAENGREFGFDLDETLRHGDHFFSEGNHHYVIEQTPEEVLEIKVMTPEQSARVAWSLGNLHFGVQVVTGAIRVTEDPAVLQLLLREKISFKRVVCVFLPLSASAHHHHGHSHHHHG